MNPSRPFILRPVGTSLMMVALFLSGLLAYKFLPVSALPNIDYPTIRVATFYPGASPDVMATSVTAPLERQFGQMAGLKQMSSSSSNGASLITLQFALKTSLDVAEQEVQAAINAATTYLPNDLPNPPVYNKVNPADTPIITIALTSETIPLSKVEDLADTHLVQKISQISGVGYVSISGGQRPAVRVQVDPNKIAAMGLTLEDIRNVIAQQNINGSLGSFDGEKIAYTIETNDQLLDSAGYANIIVTYNKGAPVRLRDIANVFDGVEDVRKAGWLNDKPAIILNVQRQPGSNVIEVADRVKALLPQLSISIPAAVKIEIVNDRTVSIRASVSDAQFEMLISICLVVAVMFVFLNNIPATFIPSVSVPLSLVGTLGVMYFFGFSLNNLTLMALTIATGFVVDDAIVMIENISRYIEQGKTPREAALLGSQQIGFTIMSLTVSLIGVLIPLLFMQDVIGRLFREFALTLSITILLSAIISLTLTPMMCAVLLRNRNRLKMGRFEEISVDTMEFMIKKYRSSLEQVLDSQFLTLLIFVLTLALTGVLLFIIPKGFFPQQDTGTIQAISLAQPSISFAAMAQKQQEIAHIIKQDRDVENVISFIGIDASNNTLNKGIMLINLKKLKQRSADINTIMQRLQQNCAQVAGVELFTQPVQDLTVEDKVSPTQFQFSVGAIQNEMVELWAKKIFDNASKLKQIKDLTSDLQARGLQTSVQIDRDTASRLGITTQNIDNMLYDAFGQRQISTIFAELNQYHVILEVLPELQQGPQALNNIFMKTTTNEYIPFAAFTKIQQQVGAQVINRQDQFPVATLSFNLAPGAYLGDAMQAFNSVIKNLNIPPSVVAQFQGAAKVFADSLSNEGWLLLAAIVVVYIILGVLYESYIHPLTILSTLPSATVGALTALILTGNELSVIALIGIILLIGIVMKNAILMIDFALAQVREQAALPRQAIVTACLLRFRPILMTTLAAMFGAVPLALATGVGAELRQPLGIAIIGGLIISQLLTLFSTPVIYLQFDKLGKWMQRKISSKTVAAGGVV